MQQALPEGDLEYKASDQSRMGVCEEEGVGPSGMESGPKACRGLEGQEVEYGVPQGKGETLGGLG